MSGVERNQGRWAGWCLTGAHSSCLLELMQEVHLAMVQQERIYPEMLMTRVLSSLFLSVERLYKLVGLLSLEVCLRG